MFDHHHYVPVLRWKRGEWVALRHLEPNDRSGMTPLIEITGRGFEPDNPDCGRNVQVRIPRASRRIAQNWGFSPIFVDLGLLDPRVRSSAGLHPVAAFFSAACSYKVFAIPVTGLQRDESYQAAVRDVIVKDRRGVCLRIGIDELMNLSLASRLNDLLETLGAQAQAADVVVDYGASQAAHPSIRYTCERLPRLQEWRTFAVVASSFPKDLQGFPVGEHLWPREDWARWRAETMTSPGLARIPTFGDYTTQHAIFDEPRPGLNVSASIRYTTDEHWVIMRGEGLRTKGSPGYAQYPANAELLCGRKEYCGPQFSYGDDYIWKVASRQIATPGSPETWLRAGINHHLTFVTRQISTVVGS